MIFKSTRDDSLKFSSSEAILTGLSPEGGLFVPDEIPAFDRTFSELSGLSYQDLAYEVMKLYLTDFTEEELRNCIGNAYDEKFDTPVIAPLKEAAGAHFLELFHGKTIAFKDMALSILPHLMTTSAKKCGLDKEIVILTATSGDTGKAALAGFDSVPGTRIIVFYPKDGVSPIQKKQMVTQPGANTFVVGIEGNFDDAQNGVKAISGNAALRAELAEAGFTFSSANSINIGRLVPQIVYYVHAYVSLLREGKIADGEKINIVVPTGNFGNILAAFYAKQMGLPVNRLICASNENKVLFDFFRTGVYDRNREFHLTSSPSMDILLSSNLERLIWLLCGQSAAENRKLMQELAETGRYTISEEMKAGLASFCGYYADEAETAQTIKKIYESDRYIIDPHTAVAACAYEKYRQDSGDDAVTVIASTASPYKFTHSVLSAIDAKYEACADFDLIAPLKELSGVPVPGAIREILDAPVKHTTVCGRDEMTSVVKGFLGIR